MVRVIYVGTSRGNFPPDKSPTIKKIIKWSEQAGLKSWSWTNLIDFKMTGNFSLSEVNDKSILKQVEGHKVIALGNQVSDYFEKRNIEHLKVPHPSGLNRMWNDPELEPKVIEKIKRFTNE